MIVEIKPSDTLFFRDGKPFSRGEETWADGVFPPYPSVIYGALRSWYISNHEEPFSEKSINESADIKLKSIQYRIPAGNYLPMPLDLAEEKGKKAEQRRQERNSKEYAVLRLSVQVKEDLLSNHPHQALLLPPDGKTLESIEQGLIQLDDLKRYLNSPDADFNIRKLDDFAQSEPKVGIGRDDFTNAATEALLYRVGMRRASEFGILIDFEWPKDGNTPPQQPFISKLGAENKIVEWRTSRQRFAISPDDVQLDSKRFKLYLATPGIFASGWEPDLSKLGVEAKLVAAAVGKPVHIGGFDMKKGKPKTMYKAVPAGSVYFYETSESPEYIKEQLFGQSISDRMTEQQSDESGSKEPGFDDQGFGITYVGNWQPNI
jgi:CRISPR-associated protein Cmr3